MIKNITTRAAMVLLAVFVLIMPATVYAEGTTSIALSGSSATVGNKVTVTISGTDSSKLSLRYNNNVFKFVSCSVADYSTEANVISFKGKSGQVTFEAVDAGSGDLVVSSDVLSGSSASVTVSAAANTASEETKAEEKSAEPEAAEEQPSDSEAEEEKEKESEEKPSKKDSNKKSNAAEGDGDYVVDGVTYVLSERYKDSEIPKGYSRTQLKIHGGTYRELTNGDLTLVYLKPADNIEGSGEFYIYDADIDRVSPFSLLGTSDYYVIVSEPEEGETDRFIETALEVGDTSYTAYRLGDEEGDFYYIYGTDSKDNTGWFSYDLAAGSVQRFNEELLNSAPAEDEEAEVTSTKKKKKDTDISEDIEEIFNSLKSSRNLIAIAVFLLVVLFIILLDVLLFRRNRSDDDEYFDDDDDYDEEDEESDGPEVLTADNLLGSEDFEEANKPHRSKKFFGRDRQTDIWDTADRRLSDTADLLASSNSGRLKKQVFKGRSSESSGDGDDGKIDLIDLNDL